MKRALVIVFVVTFLMGSAPAFAENGNGGGFFNDSYNFFKDFGKAKTTETKKKKSKKKEKKSSSYIK